MKIPTRTIPDSNGGALVASRIVSTVGCKVLSIIVLNTNALQQYIQVHEAAAVPANGSVPKLPAIPVASQQLLQIDFGSVGIDLDKCVICNSSTAAILTIGAADCAIVAVIHG